MESGIRTLPLILSMVVATLVAGGLTQRIGYYTPFMILGVCFMSVGAGLLNTLEVNSSVAKCVGYQILYGWGIGLSTQGPSMAAQTVLLKIDVPIGTSLMFFSQLLGGAIFVSVGQNVLETQLLKRLSTLPGFDPEAIHNSGVVSVANLPTSIRAKALVAYNESVRRVFLIGLIIVCVSMLAALAMEWRSVKKDARNDVEKKVLGEKDESVN